MILLPWPASGHGGDDSERRARERPRSHPPTAARQACPGARFLEVQVAEAGAGALRAAVVRIVDRRDSRAALALGGLAREGCAAKIVAGERARHALHPCTPRAGNNCRTTTQVKPRSSLGWNP